MEHVIEIAGESKDHFVPLAVLASIYSPALGLFCERRLIASRIIRSVTPS